MKLFAVTGFFYASRKGNCNDLLVRNAVGMRRAIYERVYEIYTCAETLLLFAISELDCHARRTSLSRWRYTILWIIYPRRESRRELRKKFFFGEYFTRACFIYTPYATVFGERERHKSANRAACRRDERKFHRRLFEAVYFKSHAIQVAVLALWKKPPPSRHDKIQMAGRWSLFSELSHSFSLRSLCVCPKKCK